MGTRSSAGVCAQITLGAVIALAASGCGHKPYECDRGRLGVCSLSGQQGECAAAPDGKHYCAFASAGCGGALAWHESAGGGLAGQCVPAVDMSVLVDGGVADRVEGDAPAMADQAMADVAIPDDLTAPPDQAALPCGKIGQPCCANAKCSQGTCEGGWCQPPSCIGVANTCGPNNNETCCATAMAIPGGMFNRSNDPIYPAKVSGFTLDKYEITVGRFRKFMEAGYGTRAKPPLDQSGGGVMAGTGWDAGTWNANLLVDTAALKAAVKDAQKCGVYATWTDMPGGNENRPMNCITWYESFAFCVWDGARVPTEAEWNYAAAGGSEQRPYPWSRNMMDQTIDKNYAVYGGSSAVVGSRSPQGDGRWGHSDLAGNMSEWTFDWYKNVYDNPCNNCAHINSTGLRGHRGGCYTSVASSLLSSLRNGSLAPTTRNHITGARCARTP